MLNLDAQLVWRWYRDHLSGFRESEATGEHYCHDIELSDGKTVRVPVYQPDNFGQSMAIDEKQIGEEMHTIISNRETGKIALMVRSMRYEDLQKILDADSMICRNVATLTRDLSPLYAKVGNELFFNSSAVADKFHIIRYATDACQDVRVRLRQDMLRERRLKHQQHKKREKQRKKDCQTYGKEYVSEKFQYEEEELSNGETVPEALARSRYLLFKYADNWTLSQQNRANALFAKFPEIRKVYDRCCEFRNRMKKENIGKSISILKNELNIWMQKVGQDDVDEMLNFQSLIERTPLSSWDGTDQCYQRAYH